MDLRRLRIRTKFIGVLIITAVLPLCIALAAGQLLGYRYYRNAQGTLFEIRAGELARELSITVGRQVDFLRDWLTANAIAEQLAILEQPGPRELQVELEAMAKNWESLSDSELQRFLQCDLAKQLRAFEALHPLVTELMITDTSGRVVAAATKPSGFWHGDQLWWQKTCAEAAPATFFEGLRHKGHPGFDSINVALPIRVSGKAPCGVLRGVIQIAPPLIELAPETLITNAQSLTFLFGPDWQDSPPVAGPVSISRNGAGKSGWRMARLQETGTTEVIGYALVNLGAGQDGQIAPMIALVHYRADSVLAPVRKQMRILGGIGAAMVLGCTLGGYYIATRKIITPIEALRASAQAIAASAQLRDSSPAPSRALPILQPLNQIRTGDELENLARDFAYMAGRVLTYHDQLEAELHLKTVEIERDLQLAREFQEALMPRSYPKVPSDGHQAAVLLQFHHIYRPASSVGGDFFDVLKLSDHRAGVFIADVMGHGARSALVTAILRALLQHLAFENDDPAQFMEALNGHFHDIIRESGETIFVSAFYLIIDTESAVATYASAGHPSPFVASRQGSQVVPLTCGLRGNPALGLFANHSYSKWERAVAPGDIFLLFTDGVHEAFNAEGEEFGPERILETTRKHLHDGQLLGRAVVEAVEAFIAPALPADDICLVTVEVRAFPSPGAELFDRIASTIVSSRADDENERR